MSVVPEYAPSVTPSFISFSSTVGGAARRNKDVAFNDERFPPVINGAFRRLFSMLKETNDDGQWISVPFDDEYSDIIEAFPSGSFSVEYKLLPGVCCYAIRVSVLYPNLNPPTLLDRLRNVSSDRLDWDPLFNNGTVLESVDDRISVLHMMYQSLAPKILRPRDMIVMQATRPARDGSFFLVEVSAQYEGGPKKTGCTRLTVPVQGWVVRKLTSGETELKFACELNPDNYLPDFARMKWLRSVAIAPLKLAFTSINM
ncbi:hypothetical protein RCL1_001320 [Eukaryota sp. TZLM3-RCL]